MLRSKNESIFFLIGLYFYYKSTSNKSVGKQFVTINLLNISSEKYLHFFSKVNETSKNFQLLQLTSTDNFFCALKTTSRYFTSLTHSSLSPLKSRSNYGPIFIKYDYLWLKLRLVVTANCKQILSASYN